MAALSALRTDLQRRFQDKNAGFLSAIPANLYINIAMEDFVNDVQPMSREYGYYVTAYQYRYDLPSDYIHSKAMMWYQNGIGEPISFLSQQEFKAMGYLSHRSPTSKPEHYTIIDNDLYLGPAPSTSGQTDTLNGAINSTTSTSFTVTTGTDFYDHAGIMLIDSEQIAYQAINTSSGAVTLAIRGTGGTTAATHLNGATVSRCDLIMTYAYAHTYLSADTDTPAFSSRYHRLPLQYALSLALKQSGQEEEADAAFQMYQAQKGFAKREIRRQVRDVRNRKVSTPYS